MGDAEIWRRSHPVLEDEQFGTRRKLHAHIGMIVSENKEIHIIPRSILICKHAERLLHALEHIFFMPRKAVAAGPSVSEAECDPRVKHAEEGLKHTGVEDAAQKTVFQIVNWVMRYFPIGIFALTVTAFARYGLPLLQSYMQVASCAKRMLSAGTALRMVTIYHLTASESRSTPVHRGRR